MSLASRARRAAGTGSGSPPARWRLWLLLAVLSCATWAASVRAAEAATVELFTRAGCPHCADAQDFLQRLRRDRPDLQVVVRRIDQEAAARHRLTELARQAEMPVVGVPSLFVGGHLVVGFDGPETTGRRLVALLDGSPATAWPQAGATCDPELVDGCVPPASAASATDSVETRLFGTLSAERLGLPLFTIVLGLLDGFNPCAMWLLLFLLSMLLHLRDRRRMALVAGTFVLVSGLVYYVFLAAWLQLFLIVGLTRTAQVVLGAVAAVVGAVHVKDFFALHRGPTLSVPAAVKPGLYARVRRILQAERLTEALVGVAVLAALVNVVELLCTAGIPAVYTHVLARSGLSQAAYHAYLALYDVAYMFDDAVMVIVAVVTLSCRRLSETTGRWLKLLAGLVMLFLAMALLFFPRLLE